MVVQSLGKLKFRIAEGFFNEYLIQLKLQVYTLALSEK
jgi:hypothetical protein